MLGGSKVLVRNDSIDKEARMWKVITCSVVPVIQRRVFGCFQLKHFPLGTYNENMAYHNPTDLNLKPNTVLIGTRLMVLVPELSQLFFYFIPKA